MKSFILLLALLTTLNSWAKHPEESDIATQIYHEQQIGKIEATMMIMERQEEQRQAEEDQFFAIHAEGKWAAAEYNMKEAQLLELEEIATHLLSRLDTTAKVSLEIEDESYEGGQIVDEELTKQLLDLRKEIENADPELVTFERLEEMKDSLSGYEISVEEVTQRLP